MSTATERYQNLCLGESLTRIFQYPTACKELSFILRGAYPKLPKNVQSLIFQDTLTAFRLLPEMQTGNAVSAAHILLQSAEASLPKQKKNLVVTEFKHAKVAHKRRSKACREEKGSSNLVHDVLVHIFSFLDLQSLISLAVVCRGYCLHCNKIVWHKNLKCSNRECELKYGSPQIYPISPCQAAKYVMDGYSSTSDSDSESDEEPVPGFWAYYR